MNLRNRYSISYTSIGTKDHPLSTYIVQLDQRATAHHCRGLLTYVSGLYCTPTYPCRQRLQSPSADVGLINPCPIVLSPRHPRWPVGYSELGLSDMLQVSTMNLESGLKMKRRQFLKRMMTN